MTGMIHLHQGYGLGFLEKPTGNGCLCQFLAVFFFYSKCFKSVFTSSRRRSTYMMSIIPFEHLNRIAKFQARISSAFFSIFFQDVLCKQFGQINFSLMIS